MHISVAAADIMDIVGIVDIVVDAAVVVRRKWSVTVDCNIISGLEIQIGLS